MGISDFILARVAEEEALAHAALDGLPPDRPWDSRAADDYLSRWSPWRVQSACLVNRLLVRAHRNAGPTVITMPDGAPDLVAATCQTCRQPDGQPAPWPCYTMRVLASEWSHHPDYREDWRPYRLDAGRRR